MKIYVSTLQNITWLYFVNEDIDDDNPNTF